MKKLFILLLATFYIIPTYAKSCKDFRTHADAQNYFNAKKPVYKRLDRDKDGIACDCLPGGTGKKCPNKK